MSEVAGGRARVRRAILSALAGGGVTAIGLSGPLSGAAGAAEAAAEPATPSGTSTAPAEAPPAAPTQTTTTTTTTTETPVAGTTTTPASGPVGGGEGSSTQTTQTTPTPPPARTVESPHPQPAPKVVVQRNQQDSEAGTTTVPPTAVKPPAPPGPPGSANIAPAPQLAAVQSGALAQLMAGSAASLRALGFYRIPLFLLPIYQAAAVQYGVPWPVLAAINEVETNFGSDLSVSTAGAVGWMQFMPETWLQYGVDAVEAGYADPYNPVDAIFAAARYLHAAGASHDLQGAILAYNHSQAYVESVLLRARLFASYPPSVIATLTGITEGSLPVAGARLAAGSIVPQGALAPAPGGASSATAGATPVQSTSARASKGPAHGALPGSTLAPSPAVSAARAERALDAPSPPAQLSELLGRSGAPVVAVEDGRIVGLGASRKLGRYLVLRDTYGDLFTYAGLGSIAPRYHLPKPARVRIPKGALEGGEALSEADPTPKQAASAGRQVPLTLHVAKRRASQAKRRSRVAPPAPYAAQSEVPVGGGKVRVFAHPGNPDAIAAAHARALRLGGVGKGWKKLGKGSVVAQGTVLGHLDSTLRSAESSLRFAIRPAGAQSAIDPRPILDNWRELDVALHPQGAKDTAVLAGATAGEAFLLSRSELQRAVLADPGIELGECDRKQVAAGGVNRGLLALLVFLSRSGLKPTVGELRCGHTAYTARGPLTSYPRRGSLYITAVNGVPIAGHQGAGTITDLTIRTLLTLQHQFAPRRIVSLMKYPGAPSTVAVPDHSTYIQIELGGGHTKTAASRAGGGGVARAAAAGRSSTAPMLESTVLDTLEWQRLMAQVGGLQRPKLSRRPSKSAIRDRQAAPGNGGLGAGALP
jgi:hypothetical protein